MADGDANEIAAGHETDYYAYYPYREDMGNPLDYDFSIQGDQREGITLSDFMYAANRSGTTDKVITLAFSHRLSRLQVTYTPEAGGTFRRDHPKGQGYSQYQPGNRHRQYPWSHLGYTDV